MKVIKKILISIPALYLIIMPGYLAQMTDSMPCGGINISIEDSSEYHFVSKREIADLIFRNNTKVIGQPIRDLALPIIEGRIAQLIELKEAEVYTTIDGVLHVSVDQRDPVMRVIADGGDYFVDEDGIVVPGRGLYTPRLHIVEGNIRITGPMLNGVSILDTSVKNSILKDVYQLVNYINNDNLWSAQIDQIYVDNDDEIDLIPRLGNNIIHLGTTENFEGKLRNLEAFYRKVLPVVGWNKYDLINLEFKDQIVCRKRE
jgi:cell division protein FtsQ